MSESIERSGDLGESRIAVFQEEAIRRAWHQNEWWFSIIDVVGVLSDSTVSRRYWSDLKRKLAQEAGSDQLYEKIVQLKLTAPDGKQRITDCANTETLLRIVQSIPSPNPSSAGSPKSATNEFRKSRTPNSPASAPARSTKPRATRRRGSRSACPRSPSAANSPTNVWIGCELRRQLSPRRSFHQSS